MSTMQNKIHHAWTIDCHFINDAHETTQRYFREDENLTVLNDFVVRWWGRRSLPNNTLGSAWAS